MSWSSPGVANHSDAKSHISFCSSAKSHIIHSRYNDRINIIVPLNTIHAFAWLDYSSSLYRPVSSVCNIAIGAGGMGFVASAVWVKADTHNLLTLVLPRLKAAEITTQMAEW